MPLDRKNVTIASRVMLPAYALYNTLFAVVFLTDPQGRLQRAPSLDYARGWMPVERWGLLFLALALLMVGAMIAGHRYTFIVALAVNTGSWALWGGLTGAAVFSQPLVTPLAGLPSVFVAVASFASMLSLLTRER